MNRRFGVYEDWGCDRYGVFSHCIISPATSEDEEHDGDNYLCKCGSEGMNFNIYDSLEEALQNCTYDLSKVQYVDLNEEEISIKNAFINNL